MKKNVSEENFKNGIIDRKCFHKYVYRRMGRKIQQLDVVAVIEILFEEIIEDLIKGISFNFGNYGKLSVKKMPNKRHFNKFTKQFQISEGKKHMRFYLNKKFVKFFNSFLDLEKMFPEHHANKEKK